MLTLESIRRGCVDLWAKLPADSEHRAALQALQEEADQATPAQTRALERLAAEFSRLADLIG